MEQLGIDIKFILSQIINFFILLFLLSKLLYKPILKLLEERKKKIAETLENTDKLRKELGKIEEEKIKVLAEVRGEGERILQKHRRMAEMKKEEMLTKAKSEAQNAISEAMLEIRKEEEMMLRKVEKRAGELAVTMARKLLGEIDPQTQHQIIGSLLKKLKNAKN